MEKHFENNGFELDKLKWFKKVMDENDIKPNNPAKADCECL